ncbi:Fosmidomycin resistance protein [Nocardia otitidiscaviarum]|uniref:Fosmidomycin resistance protein n=1 Tax=Nocardia otitidiscaviarum TaxID=1823 RepID=A0A379JI68_9NOCA|nr:MFS transporter [Nocardia otitidiscaviarum]SUD47951.1 Fosmidomycin resistance protein [Nocardia otitidiscaviarum]
MVARIRPSSIAALAAGHACVDVYQGAVAALVPFFVAERAYGYAAASGIVLAASLLSSVAQPLFGVFTDRRAAPWLLPVATIVSGCGTALSGIAGSYALTLTFVAVSGIGVAAYHPESARVARIISAGRHTAMGWYSLGGTIGFAAAPLLVAVVVATGGLRCTPLLLVPALAGSVLCLPVLRALGGAIHPTSAPRGTRGVDDVASFAKLALAVAFRSVVFVGTATFVALYAQQRTDGGALAGSSALFVLYLGAAVGTVLGGRLAASRKRITVVRRSYLCAVAALAGLVFVPGPPLYLCIAFTSVCLYVPFSLQVTLAQDYLPSRVGTASGVTLGLSVSVGGIASPLIGALADRTSLGTALIPLIGLPALGWLALRTLPEPANPHPAHRLDPPSPPHDRDHHAPPASPVSGATPTATRRPSRP